MALTYIDSKSTFSTATVTGVLNAGSILTQSESFAPLTTNSITLTASYSFIVPAGTIAALTIVLPASPVNNQTCRFCSSQIVSALTVTGTVVGTAPTSLAVGVSYGYRYNSTTSSWWPA